MSFRADDWQRDARHPSAAALVGFLEADLDYGMRLAWQVETQCKSGVPVRAGLLIQIDQVRVEVERWVQRARDRHIALDALESYINQFYAAIGDVGRQRKCIR